MREVNYLRGLTKEEFSKVMKDCIDKIEGLNDLDWQDIVDKYDLQIHRDVLRKSFSAPIGGYSVYKYLTEEKVNSIEDEELLNENKELLRKIQIERNKLNIEKSENKKILNDYSRVDLRFEQVMNSIEKLDKIETPKTFVRDNKQKEMVLPITDQHYGKNTLIKGLKGEIINEYNEEIFKDRMWQLLSEVKYIINKEDISIVNTMLLGDAIEGMLRQSTLMSLKTGMIDQTMQYAEFMANWLNELSKHCCVKLHYTLGNHSEARILNAKSGDFPQENLERIIMFYLKARLQENKNIEFIDNECGYIYFNCLDVNIMGTHGHEKNLETALREYSSIYKEDINLLITGHLHHNASTEIGMNTEVMRVRSLCSVDEYSMKLRKTSSAGTSVLIIEEGKGKTITYDIKLN